MIIVCPSCKKKFEVDSNIIPDTGKLLKCGSCGETWFFNKQNHVNIEKEIITKESTKSQIKETSSKPLKRQSKNIKKDFSNLPNNKGSELIKYQPKFNFTFGKILNYLIVLIISFVAVIIILDTFKSPFSIFFPNIELILYNLFETLKDLTLFIEDLK